MRKSKGCEYPADSFKWRQHDRALKERKSFGQQSSPTLLCPSIRTTNQSFGLSSLSQQPETNLQTQKWKQIETTHSRPHTFDFHIILTFTSLILIEYVLIYNGYTPERGKAGVCVIPFDDMSTSCLRIIRASHDQSAPPASNLDHEAPTPLPSWLLLGLCVRPTKGVRSPKCVWVRSQIIFLGLARFRQP